MNPVILWIAQGFGTGRVPVAPGTVGSLVGLAWLLLLAAHGSLLVFLVGLAAGFGLSVGLCGKAAELLKEKDPGSVVLDEIAAVPLCFLGWVISHAVAHGRVPNPEAFFNGGSWVITLALFALFRVFDIAKPWPVRQSQRLPGGWGIVIDDVLAAAYVAVVSLLFVI